MRSRSDFDRVRTTALITFSGVSGTGSGACRTGRPRGRFFSPLGPLGMACSFAKVYRADTLSVKLVAAGATHRSISTGARWGSPSEPSVSGGPFVYSERITLYPFSPSLFSSSMVGCFLQQYTSPFDGTSSELSPSRTHRYRSPNNWRSPPDSGRLTLATAWSWTAIGCSKEAPVKLVLAD